MFGRFTKEQLISTVGALSRPSNCNFWPFNLILLFSSKSKDEGILMCIIVSGQQTKKQLFELCPDASFKGLLHCTRATRTLAGCQAVILLSFK